MEPGRRGPEEETASDCDWYGSSGEPCGPEFSGRTEGAARVDLEVRRDARAASCGGKGQDEADHERLCHEFVDELARAGPSFRPAPARAVGCFPFASVGAVGSLVGFDCLRCSDLGLACAFAPSLIYPLLVIVVGVVIIINTLVRYGFLAGSCRYSKPACTYTNMARPGHVSLASVPLLTPPF